MCAGFLTILSVELCLEFLQGKKLDPILSTTFQHRNEYCEDFSKDRLQISLPCLSEFK